MNKETVAGIIATAVMVIWTAIDINNDKKLRKVTKENEELKAENEELKQTFETMREATTELQGVMLELQEEVIKELYAKNNSTEEN